MGTQHGVVSRRRNILIQAARHHKHEPWECTCGGPNGIELAPHWGEIQRPAARTSHVLVAGPSLWPAHRKGGGEHFRVGGFLISPARLHARPMGRTCRRAGGIELTPTGVELNGSRGAPPRAALRLALPVAAPAMANQQQIVSRM